MINVYASKIPMQWVSTKTGDKIKFLEFTNAKKPGAPITYGLRQTRPEGFELSKNFDTAMIAAIKAKGGIKTNMIVVKGVDVKFTGGKQWLVLNDGCEIFVIDAVTKKLKFKEVVNGVDARPEIAEIIRQEIRTALQEYGMETMYFGNPGGFEQMPKPTQGPVRFDDVNKWKITAQQLGAVIRDRGDDWIATLPDTTVLGTFNKMISLGSLSM
jgi:hypothetical protein